MSTTNDGGTASVAMSIRDTAISRALGYELRQVREAKGWSRGLTVARLPSGIGARTLLSYEQGTRNMTVLRLAQLCNVLGVSAPAVLATALQRAQLHLNLLHLRVDLRSMLRDETPEFQVLHRWAHRKLHRSGDTVAELTPTSVVELADFIDCEPYDLAIYLARFVPDGYPSVESLPDGPGAVITAQIVRAAGVAS